MGGDSREEINAVKTQEVEEAERSINYLMQELENTTVAESKTLPRPNPTPNRNHHACKCQGRVRLQDNRPADCSLKKRAEPSALCIVMTLVGGFISCFLVLTLARLRD